jgi:hypothetical protein
MTLDYVYLGEVGEVEVTRFEVRPEAGPTWWLTAESIYTIDGNRVTLLCASSGVERYKASTAAG